MRSDDINCAKQVTSSHYTADMYVPRNTKLEDLKPEMLKRALCPKNVMKDWHVCESCKSGCRAGNLVVSYMTGEKLRQQPVRVAPPKKKRTGRAPSESLLAKLISARDDILHGSGRDETAILYGYKNWHSLRDSMTRRGVELPPLSEKDKEKRRAHGAVMREEAIQKCLNARKLVAQGMKREEAARTVGYSCWTVVLNTYHRYEEEVDRREMCEG